MCVQIFASRMGEVEVGDVVYLINFEMLYGLLWFLDDPCCVVGTLDHFVSQNMEIFIWSGNILNYYDVKDKLT